MSDKLKNLIVRTVSGVVLLGVVLGAATGFLAYALLLFVIATVGMWEFYKIAEATGAQPRKLVGMATGVMLFATVFFMMLHILGTASTMAETCVSFILFMLLLSSVFAAELFSVAEHPLRNVASTLLGVLYVAMPLSLMLIIPVTLSGGEWSPWYFLFYLFIVWGNDVFAYLVGITLGRHRLCERISPKKSWEGFIGGIVGALGIGAAAAAILDESYVVWLGLAAVVAITAVLGDLVESMFKREAGIKDSGKILPGHGGMLDRFDALLLSSPFAFAYIVVVELIMMN